MDRGVKPKDRVGIISENRLEWIIADLATNSVGIVNVPTFPNFTSAQQKYIFSDCGAKAIIVSNKLQLELVQSVRSELEALEFVVVMNDELENKAENIYSLNTLIDEAEKYDYDKVYADFMAMCDRVKLDDLLTIIYTSGTTGNPKGVMLTNRNITSNIESILQTAIITRQDSFLSLLPMCHAYERTIIYTFLVSGSLITIAESIETLSANINEVKPTIITAVPKILETVKSKILKALDSETKTRKKLVLDALSLSQKYIDAKKIPIPDRLKLIIYDKLVLAKIRAKLGGNLRYVVSGGAALLPEIHKFFLLIGIKTLQGYGLTECSPVVSANLPTNIEVGTVGPPLKGVDVKIDDSGEILVKGQLVMQGYWQDEISTNSCNDKDGWFHTGDIGEFTVRGSLRITGRIKSIIVTSGGKNILPAPIEDMIRRSDYVEHISIFGNNQDYLVGLISPNFEQLKALALEQNIGYSNDYELVNNKEILHLVKMDVDRLQSSFAKYERIRKFVLLEKAFSVETGELTPKLSLKTNVIFEKYKNEIMKMYE
jgi:long-chain acyl-CoA synthetase